MPAPSSAPRSPGPQRIGEAVANVIDFGATGDGSTNDWAAIQEAIDTGLHVIFPQCPIAYQVRGRTLTSTALTFPNDGQRFTFLGGAAIRIGADDGGIRITGANQVFTALRVTVDTGFTPEPCVDVDGAHGLLWEDPLIECGEAVTLVRVRNTEGMTVIGGAFYGVSQLALNVGLVLGDGVKGFGAVCLSVHALGYGVILEGTSEAVSFENGTIEGCIVNMIEVRGVVRGLRLSAMHMEYGSGDIGAYEFIVIVAGGAVHGGAFVGCEFGGLRSTGPDAPLRRRSFRIAGEWVGVNVIGCWYFGTFESPEALAVWQIELGATVAQCGDMFNHWDHIEVNGAGSTGVIPNVTTGDWDLALLYPLSIAASGIALQASEIGFFGANPATRRFTYTVDPTDSHDLTTGRTSAVLACLLRDLAALGLITCVVR